MDDWLHEPGAFVVGHRATVRKAAQGSVARCTCGWDSFPYVSAATACYALVLHLQDAVRKGAVVDGGDDSDDCLGGVRQPRRPRPPHDQGSAAASPPGGRQSA